MYIVDVHLGQSLAHNNKRAKNMLCCVGFWFLFPKRMIQKFMFVSISLVVNIYRLHVVGWNGTKNN